MALDSGSIKEATVARRVWVKLADHLISICLGPESTIILLPIGFVLVLLPVPLRLRQGMGLFSQSSPKIQ